MAQASHGANGSRPILLLTCLISSDFSSCPLPPHLSLLIPALTLTDAFALLSSSAPSVLHVFHHLRANFRGAHAVHTRIITTENHLQLALGIWM